MASRRQLAAGVGLGCVCDDLGIIMLFLFVLSALHIVSVQWFHIHGLFSFLSSQISQEKGVGVVNSTDSVGMSLEEGARLSQAQNSASLITYFALALLLPQCPPVCSLRGGDDI